MKNITSLNNDIIKEILKIKEKPSYAKEQNKCIVEGYYEIKAALKASINILQILICEDIITNKIDFSKFDRTKFIYINKSIYNKIAMRENTTGYIIIANPSKCTKFDNIKDDNLLFLVCENIEKPGNLGAMMRTADAAGISALILCDYKGYLYNVNTIRASLGAVFLVPIIICSSQDAINYFKSKNINIYNAILQQAIPYTNIDFTKSSAIVVGAENEGLSNLWRTNANKNIIIPQFGNVDSLNVSVSSAIILFEAVRQRTIKL